MKSIYFKVLIYGMLSLAQTVFANSSQMSGKENIEIRLESTNESDAVASQQAQAVSNLLESRYRPSPSDILREFNGQLPNENPFMLFAKAQRTKLTVPVSNILTLVRATIDDIAYSIAVLEVTYPNALYFPMGRDAAIYADALDMFYLTVGEGKRVHRLRASGPTVHSLNATTGPQFLKSNGFGLEKRPHILIDNTGFSSGSQSRALFNFGKQLLLDLGIKEDSLYKYLAVGAAQGWTPYGDAKNIDVLKRPHESSGATLNLKVGSLFYKGGFWHPSSGQKLIELETGELAGAFAGNPSSIRERLTVLSYIYEYMRVINSQDFVNLVNKNIKEIGSRRKFDSSSINHIDYVPVDDNFSVKLEQGNMLAAFASFKVSLDRFLYARLMPTGFNTGYGIKDNITGALAFSDLLTSDELASLSEQYKAVLSRPGQRESGVHLIQTHIDQIVSQQMSEREKLKLIIERMPALGQSTAQGAESQNSLLIKKWIYRFINRPSYIFSRLASTDELIKTQELSKLIEAAYLSNKLSNVDVIAIFKNILNRIYFPTYYSYIKVDKHKGLIDGILSNSSILTEVLYSHYSGLQKYDQRQKKLFEFVKKARKKIEKKGCEDILKVAAPEIEKAA